MLTMATYIIEPSSTGPAERLAVMLQDLGHRLVFIRPHEGDAIPTDSSDIDALVIMGGQVPQLQRALDRSHQSVGSDT